MHNDFWQRNYILQAHDPIWNQNYILNTPFRRQSSCWLTSARWRNHFLGSVFRLAPSCAFLEFASSIMGIIGYDFRIDVLSWMSSKHACGVVDLLLKVQSFMDNDTNNFKHLRSRMFYYYFFLLHRIKIEYLCQQSLFSGELYKKKMLEYLETTNEEIKKKSKK